MHPKIDYTSYLDLDKLLSSQQRQSEKLGKPAHDEMLFITVHQTYEIWFKQILFELDSVIEIFKKNQVEEQDLAIIVPRLKRIVSIQKLIAGQIDVLETMTPSDFLEFRDMLYPASGFQSLQFRLIENKLGLLASKRITYNNASYCQYFPEDQKSQLASSEKTSSLFDGVHSWLKRTPFLQDKDFNFWKQYKISVTKMFKNERVLIKANEYLNDESRNKALDQVQKSENVFLTFFNQESHDELIKQGHWRLSHKAVQAALFIQLYRHEPIINLPFELIRTLLDIDELMSQWRYRHALMAKRMLGTKVGTGGSSGAEYLKATTAKHKVFSDFFQLTTFLIPSSLRPKLSTEVHNKLQFAYKK